VPFVITADQIESRAQRDLVDGALQRLSSVATLLPFTRTVGDEFQGLMDDPVSVVDAMVILMRGEQWHLGLGIGPVERPLPDDSRRARGPAFVCARAAVNAAKTESSHLCVVAARDEDHEAYDVEAVWRLVAALHRRRSGPGWEVVDLVTAGRTHTEVAERLRISRQAVGQRLQAAQWSVEEAARPTLVRLLTRADRAASA
jgi:SatD family (SatD)